MPLVRRPEAAAARLAATPFLSLHPSPSFPVLSRSRPGLREAAPGPAARRRRLADESGSNMAAPAPRHARTRPLPSPPPPRPRPNPAGALRSGSAAPQSRGQALGGARAGAGGAAAAPPREEGGDASAGEAAAAATWNAGIRED